jgi:hypothetical protein
MTLSVRVTPGATKTAIEQTPEGTWKIRLRARAVEGAANAALVEQLAEWLDVPKSHTCPAEVATFVFFAFINHATPPSASGVV